MNKDILIYDIAAIATFSLLGLASLAGAVAGYWHQLGITGMCVLVVVIHVRELIKILRK